MLQSCPHENPAYTERVPVDLPYLCLKNLLDSVQDTLRSDFGFFTITLEQEGDNENPSGVFVIEASNQADLTKIAHALKQIDLVRLIQGHVWLEALVYHHRSALAA